MNDQERSPQLDVSTIMQLPLKKRRRVYLGDFEIKSEIARGSMGKVYLAYQAKLERNVAVKFLDRQLSKDPETVRQFEQEAKGAAVLQHSHVVSIVGRGDVKGRPYFVMEYLEGGSLEDLFQREGLFGPDKAIKYMVQAAKGLREAWDHGMVHRDVKPLNLMLTKEGVLKVTDFGLAKRMEAPKEGALATAADVIVGTPYFMSPEQAQGRQVDCRSDMYSLGASFYYLLCGSHPFDGETPMEILVGHLEEPLPSLRKRLPGIPRALCSTIERMMAKKPEHRIQTYDELIETLDNLYGWYMAGGVDPVEASGDALPIQGDAAVPHTIPPQNKVGQPVPKNKRRGSPLAALAVVVIASASLLALLVYLLR